MKYGLNQALFGWLNLVLTAPSVYLWLGLPLIMRQHGWSGIDIGLFQLAGLPAVFKFLLATPVERYRFASGHYKAWAVVLCLLFAATLGLIGRQPLLGSRAELFVLALLAALMATWADVPINALAIKLLPESQRLRAGGIRSAALSLGAIVGGGLMLLVQNQWGWRAPFWLMAGFIGIGVLGLLVIKEADPPLITAPDSTIALTLTIANHRTPVDYLDIQGYLVQPGAKAWAGLLLVYFPFVGTSWFYLKPLLFDQGFAMGQVALIAGVGGGLLVALASMAAARAIQRIGLANALPGFACLSCVALAVLTGVVWLNAGTVALILAAGLIAIALGTTATLTFGVMMYFTRTDKRAADYGLQASLFALTRLLVPAMAGVLLDYAGYPGMLLVLTLATLLVLLLVIGVRHTIADAVINPTKNQLLQY